MAYEVTIGIPVYNVENYIRQTLDSVLAQTFASIEVILCDDCGTDSSIDIAREYQSSHPRGKDIRIVRQPRNMGIGAGRNLLIDEAKGKYIYFMDADDTIEPQTIELMYDNARRYNAQMVYASYERVEMFGSELKPTRRQYEPRQFSKSDEFAMWAYERYDNLAAMTWNILIDIDLLRANGIRYKPINYWEDFTTTIDYPTYADRVVMLPDVTYHYYCRLDSASNFRKRSHIDKSEIQLTVGAMALVKANSQRIMDKPYFHKRMYKVMLTHFYMVCAIMNERRAIAPPFTKREMRDVMRSPLTLGQTLRLKGWRVRNLLLCALGLLPPALSVAFIRLAGRYKGLIQKEE